MDSKTIQWLEENLKLIPDVMSKIHQNSAQNGSWAVSCNISFDDYDSMTTQVHTVFEIKTSTENMKKALGEIQAKNKGRKTKSEKNSRKHVLRKRKLLMQQQEIMTKQLQIKEIESSKDATSKQVSSATDVRPKFDRYEAEQADAKAPQFAIIPTSLLYNLQPTKNKQIWD